MNTPDFTNKTVYGTLGKLGIAMPAGGYIAVTDFHRWLCKDIAISDYPVPLGAVSPEGLQTFSDKVSDAMHLYRDYDPVDLAFLSCTSGSQVGGPGYDAYLCDVVRRESGAKQGYTTTTAVLKALRTLGSRNITICTPYPNDVNQMEKAYMEHEGFQIAEISGIETSDPRNPQLIGRIPPETIYHFAKEHIVPGSDTLFLSCTGLTTMDIIDDLERELGIPVISSNSCAIWLIGTFFGKHGENAHKLGQLFKH